MKNYFSERKSGVLLHISSLPNSKKKHGDFGKEAYDFGDFLQRAGQKIWQILPLQPIGPGNSPYASESSFAGELRYVSFSIEEVYEKLKRKKDFAQFKSKEKYWLEDYVLFSFLEKKFRTKNWTLWPSDIKKRDKKTIAHLKQKHFEKLEFLRFCQWCFFDEWKKLKNYLNAKDIIVVGDLPIFISHGSADVWSHPQDFLLNRDGSMRYVAGCPPDSFFKTGQMWGNALYDWSEMKKNNYAWWIQRIQHQLKIYDVVRLDHFIGFERYWQIPAQAKNAMNGKWMKGGSHDFFEKLQGKNKEVLPLIAEDLGSVDEKVWNLRDRFKLPGMRILQFGFSHAKMHHYHLPFSYSENSIAYTGTHDNDTILGWYQSSTLKLKQTVKNYFNTKKIDHWHFIREVMASPSCWAIIPMQDYVGLGSKARMNIPGTTKNNWGWRLPKNYYNTKLIQKISNLTKTFFR